MRIFAGQAGSSSPLDPPVVVRVVLPHHASFGPVLAVKVGSPMQVYPMFLRPKTISPHKD
jgi:hypothetical protein